MATSPVGEGPVAAELPLSALRTVEGKLVRLIEVVSTVVGAPALLVRR
jgi:hypothetical protein